MRSNGKVMATIAATVVLSGCAGIHGSLVMHRPDGTEVSCHQPGAIYVGMSGGSDSQVLRVIEERECVRQMAARGYVCESPLCRRMAGEDAEGRAVGAPSR